MKNKKKKALTIIHPRTWRMRVAIVWFLVCAVFVTAFTEDKSNNPHRYDGKDYLSWSAEHKQAYVDGLRAGVYLASYIMWEKDLNANRHINPLIEQPAAKMAEEINRVYRDPKNRDKPIAVVWRMTVEGKL